MHISSGSSHRYSDVTTATCLYIKIKIHQELTIARIVVLRYSFKGILPLAMSATYVGLPDVTCTCFISTYVFHTHIISVLSHIQSSHRLFIIITNINYYYYHHNKHKSWIRKIKLYLNTVGWKKTQTFIFFIKYIIHVYLVSISFFIQPTNQQLFDPFEKKIIIRLNNLFSEFFIHPDHHDDDDFCLVFFLHFMQVLGGKKNNKKISKRGR